MPGRELVSRAVFLLFLYIPLSMPGTMAITYVTGATWSWATVFLRPETLVALGLVVTCLGRAPSRGRLVDRIRSDAGLRLTLLMAGGFAAWYALSAVIQGAYAGFWVRNLIVGWLLPPLLALAVLSLDQGEALLSAWRGLVLGLALLTFEALVLYVVSFGVPTSFHELVYLNRTFRVHAGVRGGIYFGRLTLGEFNALAVFFVGVVGGLWGALCDVRLQTRRTTLVLLGALTCALVLEYLCYSRGAIVVLCGIIAIVGLAAWRYPQIGVRRLLSASAIQLLFFFGLFMGDGSWDYWASQFRVTAGSTSAFRLKLWKATVEGHSEGAALRRQIPESARDQMDRKLVEAFGSKEARRAAGGSNEGSTGSLAKGEGSDLAASLRTQLASRVEPRWRRLAFGYGAGNFGVFQGLIFDTSTHNMFVDTFADAGLPGFILFCGFWLSILSRLAMMALSEMRAARIDHGGPSGFALLLAVLGVSVAGALVSFQLVSLGTSISAAILWLIAVTPPSRTPAVVAVPRADGVGTAIDARRAREES